MSEDCLQYLAQLQKDWERERVKLGVEALRKEVIYIHIHNFYCNQFDILLDSRT